MSYIWIIPKPSLPPGLWKNCLPWNWSLVPKRLGTAGRNKYSGLSFSQKLNTQVICSPGWQNYDSGPDGKEYFLGMLSHAMLSSGVGLPGPSSNLSNRGSIAQSYGVLSCWDVQPDNGERQWTLKATQRPQGLITQVFARICGKRISTDLYGFRGQNQLSFPHRIT